MKLVSVVGTRPQLIKAASLLPTLRARHRDVFVDTGQHWDERLAGAFFVELGLPRPDYALGIRGGGHAEQTGRMIMALGPILEAERPDAVLVYGDTNTTLAGSLAAAKLGIRVAHVEAGLRSFDRRMPEEINRVVADHLATWCFAPTPAGVANLAAEGITTGVVLTGDLMQDLAARVAAEVRSPEALGPASDAVAAATVSGPPATLRPGGFVFATIHRAENREPSAVGAWSAILGDVVRPDLPVILALHPGTRAAIEGAGLVLPQGVLVVEPLGYRTSLALQLHAAAVLTDSGGIQRECAWLGTPCLILRSSTEWVEAVQASAGRMVVVGLDRSRVSQELDRLPPPATSEAVARTRAETLSVPPADAARRIVAALELEPVSRVRS